MKLRKSILPNATRVLLAVVANLVSILHQQPALAAAPVVGLWRFNEGSGTGVTDSSGFGNKGTFAGENGNLPIRVTGQAGFEGALWFTNNGLDHAYVDIPGSSSLKIGQTAAQPWTITAWAYEDSGGTGTFLSAYGRILVLDDGNAFQFESGAVGDGQMYTWSRANVGWQIGWSDSSPVAPLLDQWAHWAVVYDGANLTVYRNGNQGGFGGIASAAITSALGYSGYGGAVRLGSELAQSANRNWNGMLDDVAVFAGALSQAEVRTAMAGDFSAHLGGSAKILSQPQSQTVSPGADVSFSVVAQGVQPLGYQWYFNETNLLPGATSAELLRTNVQMSNAGLYSVTVSNSLGVDQSQPAVLIVNTNPILIVGLWRFNEGTGTNVTDSSGFNNNGTLFGENGNVPAWVDSQLGFGSALRFTNDGANHAYVGIPGSGSLLVGQTATNPWSITAWTYEDSGGSGTFLAIYGRILVLDDGDAFQFESGAAGDSQMYTWSRQNAGWQLGWGDSSPVAPLLDLWVHWAVVYDATNLYIYRNGNQGAQGGTTSLPVTAALGYNGYTGAALLGSELAQPANKNWNGMLDDVGVFNTALSQADVRTVMSGDFSAFITRPALSIQVSSTNVALSWTALLPGFKLQSTPSLSSPQWQNVQIASVPQGTVVTVNLPPGAQNQFYRLIAP